MESESIGVESTENWLESEPELESDFWVNLESELEPESHMGRNRASLIYIIIAEDFRFWDTIGCMELFSILYLELTLTNGDS